jgi:hypothetical protein
MEHAVVLVVTAVMDQLTAGTVVFPTAMLLLNVDNMLPQKMRPVH